MIPIKSPEEIAIMRECGKILGETLQKLKNAAKAGIKTEELNDLCLTVCEEKGTKPAFLGYHGFPGAICISINEEAVHGIPGKRKLEAGDLLSIDCGMILEGLITDATVAFVVEGKENPRAENLLKTARKALKKGIAQIKPGNKIGDIGAAIEKTVKQGGYHIIKDLTGHGVGRQLHEAPVINNFGKKGRGESIKPGMTFAIEPIIGEGTGKIKTLADNWTITTKDDSLSVQVEHTVLVTRQGNETLSLSS